MAAFHRQETAVKLIEREQGVLHGRRELRPAPAHELLNRVVERLIEIGGMGSCCEFICIFLSLGHKVNDLLFESRASLRNSKCFQRLFGSLSRARVDPLNHYVLLEHCVLQSEPDCLVHALVGRMYLRLGLPRQVDKGQVGPGLGMGRVHVIDV